MSWNVLKEYVTDCLLCVERISTCTGIFVSLFVSTGTRATPRGSCGSERVWTQT